MRMVQPLAAALVAGGVETADKRLRCFILGVLAQEAHCHSVRVGITALIACAASLWLPSAATPRIDPQQLSRAPHFTGKLERQECVEQGK